MFGSTVYDPGTGTYYAIRVVNPDGSAVSTGGGGGTAMTDDAAFVVGVSSLTPSGGVVSSDAVDAGDVGAFAMLENRQQKITLYDSSGVEITSFGGGAEYTEDAAAVANPTGGMLLLRRKDTLSATEVSADGDVIAANATAKGELHVKHADALAVTGTFWQATQPVSGTVTANAGTGLNTSTLALESGGNLATLAGAVSGTEVQVDVLTTPTSGTATLSNVSDTASSTTLLSANAARRGASIQNDSSAVLYVKFGVTSSATSYTVRLVQYAYYEVPYGYTGRIDGIWASDPGDGAARVTEFT